MAALRIYETPNIASIYVHHKDIRYSLLGRKKPSNVKFILYPHIFFKYLLRIILFCKPQVNDRNPPAQFFIFNRILRPNKVM